MQPSSESHGNVKSLLSNLLDSLMSDIYVLIPQLKLPIQHHVTLKYLKSALEFSRKGLLPVLYCTSPWTLLGFYLCSFLMGSVKDFEFPTWLMDERNSGRTPQLRGDPHRHEDQNAAPITEEPPFSSPTPHYTSTA